MSQPQKEVWGKLTQREGSVVMEYPILPSVMWSDYIYSKHSIIPVLDLGISSITHYSLSILLCLSCNKTLFFYSTRVLTVPFIIKYYLVWLYPF